MGILKGNSFDLFDLECNPLDINHGKNAHNLIKDNFVINNSFKFPSFLAFSSLEDHKKNFQNFLLEYLNFIKSR